MADVDACSDYDDHRPRIVAVIPKKMQLVQLDTPTARRGQEDEQRGEWNQNQRKQKTTPAMLQPIRSQRLPTVTEELHSQSGSKAVKSLKSSTAWNTKDERITSWMNENQDRDNLNAQNNNDYYDNSKSNLLYTDRTINYQSSVTSADYDNCDSCDWNETTDSSRIGSDSSANAIAHQRGNEYKDYNLLQKRVGGVVQTNAGRAYGETIGQDEQDGRVTQVRVSITSHERHEPNRDRNSVLSVDEEERRVNLRREYGYDSDKPERDLIGLLKDLRAAKRNMATLSPKSPRPAVTKTDKEESIWDKIGTLGRKKRIKEVQEVQEEGKHAIDSPGLPHFATTSPEDYDLEENEERCMIDQSVYTNPQFAKLVNVLINWINDELASQRIIVQDLAEDLYDGQVLQKLLEKLKGDKLDVREVTQSEEGQKQKLHAVLSHFNHVLGLSRTGSKKWNVEAIHSKNIVSIMHLLVALARHFRPPVRLTEHVSVPVVIVKKVGGHLEHRTVTEVITTSYDDVGLRWERDAIDSLFDHAPEKLQMVKKSLVTFVNKHLTKINLEVTEIETQFHDGVYLTFLMGLLEGFFVPLHAFHPTPKDFEQKVHNVCFAFELMEEVGITKLKSRPEDIVNQDLKSTLRVLYTLFMRYKHL